MRVFPLLSRDNPAVVMSVGTTLLVVRRLALIRNHWEAASIAAERAAARKTKPRGKERALDKQSGSQTTWDLDGAISAGSVAAVAAVAAASAAAAAVPRPDDFPESRSEATAATAAVDAATGGVGSSCATGCAATDADASAKANGGGGWSGRSVSVGVVESGVFLLALEVSAMVWLVGGWSSLAAIRFRCVVAKVENISRQSDKYQGRSCLGATSSWKFNSRLLP